MPRGAARPRKAMPLLALIDRGDLPAVWDDLFGRRARGLGFRAPPLDHADREDGRLVKKQGRDRKGELADDVRRGQDGGEDEDDDDGIAPTGLEEVRIDEPGARQEGQDDRQLEA